MHDKLSVPGAKGHMVNLYTMVSKEYIIEEAEEEKNLVEHENTFLI